MTELRKTKGDKVDAALAVGQLWRATEILTQRVRCGPYDSAQCEQLGQILLRMGDDLEAGRYLFASGERKPEYAAAIGFFLDRHARGGHEALLNACPSALRRLPWSSLPAAVRKDFEEIGLRRDAQQPLRAKYEKPRLRPWGCALRFVLLAVLALSAMAAVRGCSVGFR